MSDKDWGPHGKGGWIYTTYGHGHQYNTAIIQIRKPNEWNLFINSQHIATFTTWEEARDATPMMLQLHGYESNT